MIQGINSREERGLIIYTDDVNGENVEDVIDFYNKKTKYINTKFSMPIDKDIEFRQSELNSIVLAILSAKLEELHNDVNNKANTVIQNETQYNNFRVKVIHWTNVDFFDEIQRIDRGEKSYILIDNQLSKHEWIYIQWLADIGIEFYVIDRSKEKKDTQYTNAILDAKGTKEDRYYKVVKSRISSLADIEDRLKEGKEIKIYVSGIANYSDTCDFYAMLNAEGRKNAEYALCIDGFGTPSYEETSKIPRINSNDKGNIIKGIVRYVKDKRVARAIESKFLSNKYESSTPQVVYNKIVYATLVLNRVVAEGTKVVIFYGNMNNNDKMILDILSTTDNISLIVLNPNKEKFKQIDNLEVLELEDTYENFEMPTMNKRNSISTLAANAERTVKETLFNGDTLGMYKPGQFINCNPVNFNTTYEEIKVWWNKELYLRPGFSAKGNTATIPTMFKIIKGVNSEPITYINEVQKYCCGKTILCKSKNDIEKLFNERVTFRIRGGVDINKTLFYEQKALYENGKIQKNRIKESRNYQYKLLDMSKQDLILNKIERVINNDKINKDSLAKEVYIDSVLNIGLNLSEEILQNIQWFEFYTYNPNIVIVLTKKDIIDMYDTILLALLQELGFDILIFVPTSYTSIESYAGSNLVYDLHRIGEARYDIDNNLLAVTNNILIEAEQAVEQKKQGFWSKLFSL